MTRKLALVFLLIAGFLGYLAVAPALAAAELTVDDFSFEGPLGSAGAKIEKVDTNHFKIVLDHAPGHPEWANMAQFTVLRNAKGNRLRVDVFFHGGNTMKFNDYSYSWSHDGRNWQPIHWQHRTKDGKQGDTLRFPEFTEDTVYVGHQVPMSYDDVVRLMKQFQKHPHATVHVLGQSTGGRDIYRLTITDPQSPHPADVRWGHYFANQHPGECVAQWRMVGMIDWLLSDAGADCRRRSICHFVLMMSPDGPSHGWYRVNSAGKDMNRTYRVEGADPEVQTREPYLGQKDLETLMTSKTPPVDVWSMHTWQGPVEPILRPGPEIGTEVGPWTEFRDILLANAPEELIEPLKTSGPGSSKYWCGGPHQQFNVTGVLCEGVGSTYTKAETLRAGRALMKSIAEYYRGVRK